jgi:hypothetical protein
LDIVINNPKEVILAQNRTLCAQRTQCWHDPVVTRSGFHHFSLERCGRYIFLWWRGIMVEAWASRAVTLSSLVIRLVNAAQAGVCTSMLVALLLERSGVLLFLTADSSIVRSSNIGPHNLALKVLQAFPQICGFSIIAILSTLVVTTLLSQFCSTALLFDLNSGMIVTWTNTLKSCTESSTTLPSTSCTKGCITSLPSLHCIQRLPSIQRF